MPNHAHAVIAFHNTGQTISSIAGNGKRFMAYDIVERLQKQNNHDILLQIQDMVVQQNFILKGYKEFIL